MTPGSWNIAIGVQNKIVVCLFVFGQVRCLQRRRRSKLLQRLEGYFGQSTPGSSGTRANEDSKEPYGVLYFVGGCDGTASHHVSVSIRAALQKEPLDTLKVKLLGQTIGSVQVHGR